MFDPNFMFNIFNNVIEFGLLYQSQSFSMRSSPENALAQGHESDTEMWWNCVRSIIDHIILIRETTKNFRHHKEIQATDMINQSANGECRTRDKCVNLPPISDSQFDLVATAEIKKTCLFFTRLANLRQTCGKCVRTFWAKVELNDILNISIYLSKTI